MCLSCLLSLPTPTTPVDVTGHTVFGGKQPEQQQQQQQKAATGRNARSPEELLWCHSLTSCLLLLLSSPTLLLPSHSYHALRARVPVFMPGHRTQGQAGLEEVGAQLQPVGGVRGPPCLEHTG